MSAVIMRMFIPRFKKRRNSSCVIRSAVIFGLEGPDYGMLRDLLNVSQSTWLATEESDDRRPETTCHARSAIFAVSRTQPAERCRG